MENTTHTAKKWKIFLGRMVDENMNQIKVPKTLFDLVDNDDEEGIANAKFLASSPELLKRLKDIISGIEEEIITSKITTDSLYYKYGKEAIEEATK